MGDNPRQWSWSARFLVGAACLGAFLGGWGLVKAEDAQDALHSYVANQEAETDLALFRGCVTGNRDGRFGQRVTADVLRDLLLVTNASVRSQGRGDQLPPAYLNGPDRLARVTARNQPRPCPTLYPEGYRRFLESRGG